MIWKTRCFVVAMGGHATGAAPTDTMRRRDGGMGEGGRHPERFAGAAAWVPIHDLVPWYDYNVPLDTSYVAEIVASCGGEPLEEPDARDECLQRSPVTHLDAARDAELPFYLAAEWMAAVAG
ncbi:hypothetical protein BH20ACT3_BH20ACT3_11490 [soil metagenome]